MLTSWRINRLIIRAFLAMFMVAYATGCSFSHYPLIKQQVSEGRIPQLVSATGYTYVFPETVDGQRFSRVELLQNVMVDTPNGRVACSFVLGKKTEDGKWTVINAAIKSEESWKEIEVISNTGYSMLTRTYAQQDSNSHAGP